MAATWRANAVGACTFGTDWKLEKGQPGAIDKIDFLCDFFWKAKKGGKKNHDVVMYNNNHGIIQWLFF